MLGKIFQRVSEAPTNPQSRPPSREFDVAELYRGPATVETDGQSTGLPLDEKLRQGLYLAKALYPTAALYAVFLALAVCGWWSWRRSWKTQGTA